MANGYIEVSKREPCPICGTGDYCCHKPAEDGFGEVYICKRFTDARVINPGGDTPSKTDGGFYLLLNVSKDGYGIYREASDVKAARDAGFKVWQKGTDNANAVRGPGASAKELIPVGINEIADDTTLDKFYRELIHRFPLTKHDEEYLLKEGWPLKLIRESNLCHFPVEDWKRGWQKNCKYLPEDTSQKRAAAVCEIIEKLGEPAGIPGFYIHTDKKGDKYWDLFTRSGIGFPLPNQKKEIVRIRVRMNFLDVCKTYEKDPANGIFFRGEDNKRRFVSWGGVKREEFDGTLVTEKDRKYRCSGKYRGLSSFEQQNNYEEGTYTNRFENGTEGTNIVGLVENDGDNKFMCILTEGEKKAYLGNYTLKAPFVIVPGVNSYGKLFDTRVGKNILEHLVNEGVEVFAIAFDADKYENPMVMRSERGLALRLLSAGLKPATLGWDKAYGKGLDDCIVHHGQFKCKTFDTEEQIEQYYSQFNL